MVGNKFSSLSLYIHIPFCQSKCGYCDFNSYSGLGHLIPKYVDALIYELQLRAGSAGRTISTIYFGGGTPSLLTESQLARVVEACHSHFEVDRVAEITLEANPGSITLQWLKALREMGFNRLSLGFQSLDDSELKLLGRVHSASQALDAYSMARQAGFDNINIDLIYGLPEQPLEQWQKTLSHTLSLSPEHLSLYPLTLEEATPLGRAVERGSIPAPDPDAAADMYIWAEEKLEAAGYEHYELSNWARPPIYRCQHNLTYWKRLPYLGLGAGAHSFINSYRVANLPHPLEYISRLEADRLPEAEREYLSRPLELSETLILGLRLGEGMDIDNLKLLFGEDVDSLYRAEIEELQGLDLLERDARRLRLTRRGRLLGNEVFCRFLPKRAG